MTTPAKKAGIHEQIFPHRKQRYTIATPDGYTDEETVPLVLALHTGGTVTPFYGKTVLACLVEPDLRELGAIMEGVGSS